MKNIFALTIICFWYLGLFAQNPNISNWLADIDFYEKTLRSKHKNPFHFQSEEAFKQQIANLKDRLGQLSNYQVIVELSKIAASIGDGHTYIHTDQLKQHWLPVKLEIFEEGVYILNTLPEYKELIGGRILSFDEKSTEEVIAALKLTCATDLRFDEKDYYSHLPVKMMQASLLHALGLIKTPEQSLIRVEKDGKEVNMELKHVDALAQDFLKLDFVSYFSRDAQRPVSFQNLNKNYWFTYLPNHKAMYLGYHSSQQDDDEKMDAFTDRLFAEFKKNKAEKLIIDVRRNGGGNSNIHKKLVKTIIEDPEINQKGHLFVLIGARTFSASNILVLDLENYAQVITIGEHGRGKPNHYSENFFFKLPHSQVRCSVSELYRIDSKKEDKRIRIEPQIQVPNRFSDYKLNHDAVLEKALSYSNS